MTSFFSLVENQLYLPVDWILSFTYSYSKEVSESEPILDAAFSEVIRYYIEIHPPDKIV